MRTGICGIGMVGIIYNILVEILDAEYAQKLAAEEAENATSNKPTSFSNVKQIIEMEVALATCKIDNVSKFG